MPKIKPVKAWGLLRHNGQLRPWVAPVRNHISEINAKARDEKIVRVEIRVLPKRKKVSR